MSTVGAFLTYEFQSIRFLENPWKSNHVESYATIHQISYENSSLSHHPIGTWQNSAPLPQQTPTSGARLEPHQHRPGGTARWIAGRPLGPVTITVTLAPPTWSSNKQGHFWISCWIFLWRWKPKTATFFFDVLVTLTLQILQNTRTLGTLGHCLSIVYVFGVALHYLYVIKIPEQPLSDKLPEGRSEAPNFGFTWPMICAFSSPQDLANGDWFSPLFFWIPRRCLRQEAK